MYKSSEEIYFLIHLYDGNNHQSSFQIHYREVLEISIDRPRFFFGNPLSRYKGINPFSEDLQISNYEQIIEYPCNLRPLEGSRRDANEREREREKE